MAIVAGSRPEDRTLFRYQVDGHRATLTIDDPARRNPLSAAVMAKLRTAVDEAAADTQVRVLVFTGAGDKAFSAGGDLSGGFVDDPLARHKARGALAATFRAIRRCGKPTVARVNGAALGGGFGLAAVCDIVIAAEHALMGTPEIDLALWPMMISAVLRDIVPRRALLEMMLTGRRLTAVEARDMGIVSRVVAASDLDGAVDDIVEVLTAKSPVALRLGRDAYYAMLGMDFDAALDHLQSGLTALAMTDDATEGVAAFVEKRKPRWSGR